METQSVTERTFCPSRFENGRPVFAGLKGRYTFETMAKIPQQWQRFVPQIDSLPGQGKVAYGVVGTPDKKGFDLLTAVGVAGDSGLPKPVWMPIKR